MIHKFLLLAAILVMVAMPLGAAIVTEVNFTKVVNSDAGLEFLVKDTINYPGFDIKWGISECFTAPRESIFSLNHEGIRWDIGVYWKLSDFLVGYTHSERFMYDGASNTDVFDLRPRDTLSIRKEF